LTDPLEIDEARNAVPSNVGHVEPGALVARPRDEIRDLGKACENASHAEGSADRAWAWPAWRQERQKAKIAVIPKGTTHEF
jgi:hypothetical protein